MKPGLSWLRSAGTLNVVSHGLKNRVEFSRLVPPDGWSASGSGGFGPFWVKTTTPERAKVP